MRAACYNSVNLELKIKSCIRQETPTLHHHQPSRMASKKKKPVISEEQLLKACSVASDEGAKNSDDFLSSEIFNAVCEVLPGSHKGSRDYRFRQKWKSTLGKRGEKYRKFIDKALLQIAEEKVSELAEVAGLEKTVDPLPMTNEEEFSIDPKAVRLKNIQLNLAGTSAVIANGARARRAFTLPNGSHRDLRFQTLRRTCAFDAVEASLRHCRGHGAQVDVGISEMSELTEPKLVHPQHDLLKRLALRSNIIEKYISPVDKIKNGDCTTSIGNVLRKIKFTSSTIRLKCDRNCSPPELWKNTFCSFKRAFGADTDLKHIEEALLEEESRKCSNCNNGTMERRQYLRDVIAFDHPINIKNRKYGGRVLMKQTINNLGAVKSFNFKGDTFELAAIVLIDESGDHFTTGIFIGEELVELDDMNPYKSAKLQQFIPEVFFFKRSTN